MHPVKEILNIAYRLRRALVSTLEVSKQQISLISLNTREKKLTIYRLDRTSGLLDETNLRLFLLTRLV